MPASQTMVANCETEIAALEHHVQMLEFARERFQRMFLGQEGSPEFKSTLANNEVALQAIRLDLAQARDRLAGLKAEK